jgi:DNA sulfur modification protein DndB
MANLHSAIKAQMGDTPYYITRMSLLELVASSRPPYDRDKWAGQSIEERMQRDPNIPRVKRDIIPYLFEDDHRFFGAFIVLVDHGSIEFESLTELIPTLPKAYRQEGDESGFITLKSNENIILDGQHRWYAAQLAMKDKDRPTDQIAADQVTVLFIENTDARKTRGIFNKINRYAKPTSRSDNIITSEDDGYFIVTRMLLDPGLDGPLADFTRKLPYDKEELVQPVQWQSTTLSKSMKNLTTISAVSDNVQAILDYTDKVDIGSVDTKRRRGAARPRQDLIEHDYEIVREWIEKLLDQLDAYRAGLEDLGALINKKVEGNVEVGRRFDDTDRHTLLFRPVGQVVLVRALVKALDLSATKSSSLRPKVTVDELISRVNRVDFSMTPGSKWQGSIVSNDGRMVAREEAVRQASDLLAYLIASEHFDDELREALWVDWNGWQGRDVKTPVEELKAAGEGHRVPRPLPEPVKTTPAEG